MRLFGLGFGYRRSNARPNVTPDRLARGEEGAIVAIGPQDDYVELRYEEEDEGDRGAQRHAHAHRYHLRQFRGCQDHGLQNNGKAEETRELDMSYAVLYTFW